MAAHTGKDFDVVVVGGGNAGHCAALAAAERGRRVVLLEKGRRGEHGSRAVDRDLRMVPVPVDSGGADHAGVGGRVSQPLVLWPVADGGDHHDVIDDRVPDGLLKRVGPAARERKEVPA